MDESTHKTKDAAGVAVFYGSCRCVADCVSQQLVDGRDAITA
jgi:hypothetical protein